MKLSQRILNFYNTALEYQKTASQLPLEYNFNESHIYIKNESYQPLFMRAMISRKYYTTVSKKQVYLPSVIEDCIISFPKDAEQLEKFKLEFEQILKQDTKLILEDGDELDIFEVTDLIIYGIYLHADEKKYNRLKNINEIHLVTCLGNFMRPMEDIILGLLNFIKNKVNSNTDSKTKNTLIRFNQDTGERSISPGLNFINAQDVEDETALKVINDSDEQSKHLFEFSCAFITLLTSSETDQEVLNKFISKEYPWETETFIAEKNFFESINHFGLATNVRYNAERTQASIMILDGITSSSIIKGTHLLNKASFIKCIKKPCEIANWSIYKIIHE